MSKKWDQAVVQQYITDEVQESLTLEYKAADALGKSDGKKKEVTKDVSAMANSAGGTMIYGVAEYQIPDKEHLPEKIDPVDQTKFSKEWLEQVINNVRPRIDGIVITPVPVAPGSTDAVYVVEIPPSTTAHQATDWRYYKRYNFLSVPMEDHEIRDVMRRQQYPFLSIAAASVEITAQERVKDHTRILVFGLHCTVENASLSWAEDVRLGIIAWVERNPPQTLSNHLLSYVEVQEPNKGFDKEGVYNLSHTELPSYGYPVGLDPFSIAVLGTSNSNVIPIRGLSGFYRYTWKAAVYLICKKAPPVWYQLDLVVNQKLLELANSNGKISDSSELLDLRRLSGKRPIVAWDGFGVLPWNTSG